MIAGGNHSTVKRWLSVSETGGVCSSNRAVQETPQSAYGCQLPFQGRPWQNQNPPPFNAQLNFPTLRAAISRPYKAYSFNRVLAKNRGCGRLLAAPTVRVGNPPPFTQPLCPISWQGKRFGVQYVTGRVREPTYWYAVRSVSKKARWTQMGTGVQRAFYV